MEGTMGIDNTDRTLASNRLVFEVRRDMAAYRRFRENFELVMEEYGLTEEEKEAWRALDLKKLGDLGVHPYFLPQISRLFHGGGYNHNRSEACKAYAASVLAVPAGDQK